MGDWLNFIATIGVACIGLAGVKIQLNTKNKWENIEGKIDLLSNQSKSDDAKLNNKLDTNHREILKVWLVTELTKIKNGSYAPNEEQKQLIHDAKRAYNELHGNSYVDTMFDGLVDKGLL